MCLDWHSCQICYPLEIKVALLLQVSEVIALNSNFTLFSSKINLI